MKTTIAAVIALITLSSCGTMKKDNNTVDITETIELQNLLVSVIEDFKSLNVHESKLATNAIRIGIGKLAENTEASCFTKSKTIVVNAALWERKNTIHEKKYTIAHELGHCLFNIDDHDDSHSTLMNTYINPVGSNEDYRTYLKDFIITNHLDK